MREGAGGGDCGGGSEGSGRDTSFGLRCLTRDAAGRPGHGSLSSGLETRDARQSRLENNSFETAGSRLQPHTSSFRPGKVQRRREPGPSAPCAAGESRKPLLRNYKPPTIGVASGSSSKSRLANYYI